MSSLRPESHVAQQIRRDKLRIQNSCSYSQEFPNSNNLEQQLSSSHNLDLLQVRNVRNANTLDDEPSIYSSSEVPNFQSDLLNTLSGPRNTLEYHHQEQLGATAEPSRLMMNQYANSELRNLGNWRIGNSGSNQGCDWVVNYASSSMENTESNNHSTPLLASQINNVAYHQHYMKPSYNEQVTDVQSSLNREIQKQLLGGMLRSHSSSSSASPLYQNALHDIVKSAAISAQGSDHMASLMQQTGHDGIWVGDAIELDIHPSHVNHSNHIHHGSGNPWMNRTVVDNSLRCSNPLSFTEKKVDEHHQSLSLSLSSNAQSKTEEGSASDDLHSGCGVSNKDPQYMKHVKSFMKPQDTVVSPSSTCYKNVGPLGPFTGYATILKSSRFLKSAQQLLDEFCCLSSPKATNGWDVSERVSGGEASASTSADAVTVNEAEAAAAAETKGGSNSGSSFSMFYCANENSADWGTGSGSSVSPKPDYQQKKASLLFMQEEVTKRYKQYHQQMQMVVSSFESVAGLSSSTPYISLALKSVSRHFRCLKNCISDQLKQISEALGEDFSIPSTSTCSNVDPDMGRLRCMGQSIQKNKPGRGSTGLVEPPQPAWRAQRGLPERAVAVLKAWLFEHFLHPYPTDTDKHMLATQTGLSRNQVSNWFINARVRVWKPMVEEIHMLETKGTTSVVNQNTRENEGTCGTEDGGTSIQHYPPRMDKPLNKFGMIHSIPENQSHHQYMEMDSSVACNVEEVGNAGLNAAEQWSQEKRSKLECQQQMNTTGLDNGSLMGFVPYTRRSSGGLEVGGLGSVSLTLGLRHGVEGVQNQQQQQLQEEQLRHHFGGHMIHDFVG